MQAEGEVWAWEGGQGLDEDVGDGLVPGQVWVELVAIDSQFQNGLMQYFETRGRIWAACGLIVR